MVAKLHEGRFVFDGRGPELMRIWWSDDGSQIEAIDYENPNGRPIAHVTFRGAQTVMITPDEVADHSHSGGLLDFGRSPWMNGFNPHHLTKCRHYRLVFYDQVIDVLCEDVAVNEGRYGGTAI